jgi:hypothetical protein
MEGAMVRGRVAGAAASQPGRIAAALLWFAVAAAAGAQPAVALTNEPHHHLGYSDSLLRVFRVEVPPRTNTFLHEHAVDYFWIAVGASEFINAVAGKPDAKVTAADASIHFTRGGFAHVARNEGGAPFFNVTLELLRAQTNPRNLCEQVIPAGPLDCPRAMARAGDEYSGAALRPSFETNELRVTLLTLESGGTLQIAPQTDPPLLVTVDDTDGEATLRCEVLGAAERNALGSRSGDVSTLSKSVACAIRNPGPSRVRLLALNFKPGSG